MTDSPSAILSRAADLIRDTAAAADDGPWIVYRDGWCILSQPDRDDRATWRTVCSEGFTPENGRWIALLSPAVAPAMADLLQQMTGMWRLYEDRPLPRREIEQRVGSAAVAALALAERITGERAVLGVQEEASDAS